MKLKVRPFRDWKLRNKFSLVVVGNMAITLALLGFIYIHGQGVQGRRAMVAELTAVLDTIAANSTAAISFSDQGTAADTLEGLRADSRIEGAAIFDKNGQILASYQRDVVSKGLQDPGTAGNVFGDDDLVLTRNVLWNGEVIGRVCARADLVQYRRAMRDSATLGTGVLLLALLIGYLSSRYLSNVITRPIHDLAGTARRLTADPSSDIRLVKTSNDEVGELTEWFGSMLEHIQERDRELNLHRHSLEALVETRTEELRVARERAEEAVRLKSEFLANMSHEIRTPMNGVLGLTALALDLKLPAEAREYLELVQYSARSLLNVINDILDFSKIEAGRMGLETIPFDLVESAGRLLRTMAIRAREKELELIYDADPEIPPRIVGDPTRLQQVLTNLIGNALKFTESGEISVVLRVTAIGKNRVTIQFRVSDTGIGIPEAKQRSIFEAFTQADGSTTRKYGGTGLGLAISSRLVSFMGGEIRVESIPGQGSSFWFELTFPVEAEKVAANDSRLQGVRVLVVDDHPANVRILASYASRFGMRPETVESAVEGVDAVERAIAARDPFQIVFADYQMPEKSGIDLAIELKARRFVPQPQIAILSSIDRAEISRRCDAAGVEHIRTKPIAPEDLRSLALEILSDAPQESSSEQSVGNPDSVHLRVLVAEDNLINQRVIGRLLEKLGHSASIVADGSAAVRLANEERFDAILMDCQMPVLDGLEAARMIRNSPSERLRGIPIIALTAYALKGDRERCAAAGMSDYLSKPIDAQQLASMLRSIAAHQDSGVPVSAS